LYLRISGDGRHLHEWVPDGWVPAGRLGHARLGDWREEVVHTSAGHSHLSIFTTDHHITYPGR
jgi:hypothetical protein